VEVQEAIGMLINNRRMFKETLFEVENKNRELVPFKLNNIQTRMEEDSGARDVYVKPASIGATTWCVADYLEDNLTINGTVSCIISYDEWVAQRQLIKAKKFYNALKNKIPSIPRLDHNAAHHLSFEYIDPRTEAVTFHTDFYIYSARSYTIGRGEAIHNLLLDEYAFWPEGTHDTVYASAVQRVPLQKNTRIRILSTANGEDNPHHEIYVAAKEGKLVGRNVYSPHFYPWYIHEEYEMWPDDYFCLPGDSVYPLTGLKLEERALLDIFERMGISEEQAHAKLRWRRYKVVEILSLRRIGDTLYIFEQEYPEDDETCFVTAGDMAYDPETIMDKLRDCYPAPESTTVTDTKTNTSAHVDIWYPPESGLGYVLSIDPGKGKTSEAVGQVWTFKEGFIDKDGNEIPVVMRHCATIAGLYDEAEMGAYCKELGYYYKDTVLCPEDNLDLVSHIKDYPQLYYREDPRDNRMYRSIGWFTSPSTKPYMITELNRHLTEIECYDQRFWSQCRNIRRDRSVKTGIKVVGADDHHDAGAIAIVCRSAMPVAVCRSAMPVARGYVGNTGDNGGWNESWGQ